MNLAKTPFSGNLVSAFESSLIDGGLSCYIRQMPTYARVIAARFAFLLCGAVAVGISAVLQIVANLFPGCVRAMAYLVHRPFTVGGVSLVAAMIPRKWIVKMRGSDLGNEFQRKLPIRMLLGFAAFSYLSIVGLTLFHKQSCTRSAPRVRSPLQLILR